jgi:hypothetical protein
MISVLGQKENLTAIQIRENSLPFHVPGKLIVTITYRQVRSVQQRYMNSNWVASPGRAHKRDNSTRRMPPFVILRRVPLVRTNVSEERIASIIRVLGTLAVN